MPDSHQAVKKSHWVKWILFGLFATLLAAVLIFALVAHSIYTYSHLTSPKPADAALVLGAAAWGDRPSPVFRERINQAIQLYQKKQVKKLVFTGGTPKPGYATEAEVARRYAIKLGIPQQDILIEDQSRTTFDNLINASKEGKAVGIHSYLIVSDPIHMKRAMAMANDLNLKAYPSPTQSSRYNSPQLKAKFLVQETFNYIAYRIFRHVS